MTDARQDGQGTTPPSPPPLAPLLMTAFWALLGGAAGVKLTQSVWQFLGWTDGEVSVAVPVGGAAGAICGALLGLITSPRLLMLLMAVFAGSSAGAVAGQLPWGGTSGGSVARSPAGWSGGSPGRRGCTSDARGVEPPDPSGRTDMRITGISLVLIGVVVGASCGIGYMLTSPDARSTPITMIVAAVGSVLAGAAALAFGGKGYIVSGDPSVHN